MWTLAIYLVGTGFSALAFKGGGGLVYFYATRFIAGTGIGGEYSAVNSAIDEMMPARYRGRTDIWINGSYWLGSIIGTFAAFLLLNSLPADTGWRLGFLVGPVLAIVILVIRRNLPESPRWLLTHGRAQEAEASMMRHRRTHPLEGRAASLARSRRRRHHHHAREGIRHDLMLLRLILHTYPRRAILGGTLMITQSFLYNAIFFTYALVLTKFYHVTDNAVPLYGLAFAVGNLAGPASRPSVRHPGPPEDDLRHVPDLRGGASLQRLAVQRALVRVAQTVNAQLIVLTARQGIARVLGTVSQYVLRNAPCPVLTVPEADADSRGLEAAQQHPISPTA